MQFTWAKRTALFTWYQLATEPYSPNVVKPVGGLPAFVGLFFAQFVAVNAFTLALATGIAVSLMLVTKTTHPPAGANPLLIMLSGQGWGFLITPVLVGAVIIVLVGKWFGVIREKWVTNFSV